MVLPTPSTTVPLQARHLRCSFVAQSIKVQHNVQNRICTLLSTSHHVLLPHSYYSRIAPCHAYVGEQSKTAGEYHSQDFNWEMCLEEGAAAVERQRQEWRTRAHEHVYLDTKSKMLKENENIKKDSTVSSIVGALSGNSETKDIGWEAFHQRHTAARFFKEKRYIPLEFPVLMKPDLHVAEIGCGCGSALLPVLKANPTSRGTACDVSPTAIELLKVAAEREGIDVHRIHSFAYDASSTEIIPTQATPEIHMNTIATQDEGIIDAAASGPLAGLDADCVLMIFTLSALWPKDMLCMLRHAYHALRPDGLLLFRDYGLYDMAQLRFSGSQLLDPGEFLLYQRLDGTLSSFFSIERMEKLAHDAGFQVVECEYVTTFVKNRRKKTQMKRIFVHGVFKKREKLI